MTALAVIGMGLVSPLGRTPSEHALFLRADVGPPAPGAFLDAKGETIAVSYCPWIDAERPVADRLRALGLLALAEALRPLGAERGERKVRTPPRLLVASSAPRLGLEECDRAALEEAVSVHGEEQSSVRLTGEAGFFRGLTLAGNILERGDARMVAIVAADTFVTSAYLAEAGRRAEMPWDADLPPPSEGAAAILLATPATAREERLDVLATIRHAATATGGATDDNDAVIDGAAMTSLLRGLPELGLAVGAAFGQHGVGSLRRREWEMAAARSARIFDPTCAFTCLETKLGTLGAAAGAANFVHAATVHRLAAWSWSEGKRHDAPFVAWAISPDGTRGLALAKSETKERASDPARLEDAAPPEPHAATWGRPRALTLRGARELEDEAPTSSGSPSPSMSSGAIDSGELARALGRVPRSAVPVTLDADRAAATPARAHYAEVIEECLERLAMLARHRDERPVRARAGIEARVLAQVDAIIEAHATVEDLVAFWKQEVDGDPWAAWAVAFTLCCLNARDALRELCEGLPANATQAARLVAEALVASPSGARDAFGRELMRSAASLAHAAGIELLSRIGALDHEVALAALDHESPSVRVAGIRAVARYQVTDAALARLVQCLHTEDAAVAREAGRALSQFGRDDALVEVRDLGQLASALGESALELFVLRGELNDINIMQRLVSRLPASELVLSAIGRFGHPAAWSYLIHGLTKADLAEAAHRALVTLFGPVVVGARAMDPAAWREALEIGGIPQGVRLRHGHAWSATAVMAECARDDLSRWEIELRYDELRARTGKLVHADLGAWGSPRLVS